MGICVYRHIHAFVFVINLLVFARLRQIASAEDRSDAAHPRANVLDFRDVICPIKSSSLVVVRKKSSAYSIESMYNNLQQNYSSSVYKTQIITIFEARLRLF